jgi:ElaB/YqjD/DUF883 family membrane-anchored ribosome-binding protein
MEQRLSKPADNRPVLDHAANEPESPKKADTAYERERQRIERARTYFQDTDAVNAAIREQPAKAMFIAAGIGFVFALLMRR